MAITGSVVITEVEYLRRDNKRLRQQCSAEGKKKYAEALKDAVGRAEQRELEACAEADTLKAQLKTARKAVKEFLDIGKRDLSNPKYNDYWDALAQIDAGQSKPKSQDWRDEAFEDS